MSHHSTFTNKFTALFLGTVCAALALTVFARGASAEVTSSSSVTTTVVSEPLEKDIKKFIGSSLHKKNARAIAEKIRMVERRIAELKMHIERYEMLLNKLKAVDNTASTTLRVPVKNILKERASSTRTLRGDVRGAATTSVAVPVIPVCRLSFDKVWYTLGSEMKVSWKSTGASYVEFVTLPSDEGKDGLNLPTEQMDSADTTSITASVLGLPTVMLRATSVTGHTSVCNRTVSILDADATLTDKRLTAYYNQLKQLGIQEQRITAQEQKLLQNRNKIYSQIIAVQQKINNILGTTEVSEVDITFAKSVSNPDASTIVVDKSVVLEDNTIMVFDVDVDNVDKLPVEKMYVKLTSSAPLASVLNEVALNIKGVEYKATNVPGATAKTFVYEFNVAGFTLNETDGDLPISVVVAFNSQEKSAGVARYANRTTLKAEVTTAERDRTIVTGGNVGFQGTAIGETHTLVAGGLIIDPESVKTSEVVSGTNGTLGTFTMSYSVTAIGGDYYIPKTTGYTLGNKTVGINYRIDGASGTVVSTGVSALFASTADEASGYFEVEAGETETITLEVTYDPAVTGSYRLQGLGMNYNDTPAAPDTSVLTLPFTSFKTPAINISGS